MTQRDATPLGPEQIAANLARFERVAAGRPELKQASVAVCIIADEARDPTSDSTSSSLLITRRAPTLRAHAGQWALPGGRLDAAETIEHAALRELAEETGLRLEPDTVLGMLDDYVTRSGYVMTPVVVWGGVAARELRGSASEVARVYRVPLTDLDVEPEFLAIPESSAPVIRLPLFERYVHAPTAAIIYQFCQVALHGREQRVAHFEAPVFLWR